MEEIQKTGTEDSDDAGLRYLFTKKPLRSQRIDIYKKIYFIYEKTIPGRDGE
jgi:hypothetical protein